MKLFQLTRDRYHDSVEWPDWLQARWAGGGEDTLVGLLWLSVEPVMLGVIDGHGVHPVRWGDFLVLSDEGGLYVLQSDLAAVLGIGEGE